VNEERKPPSGSVYSLAGAIKRSDHKYSLDRR
jgi:hypothetical protein